MHETRNRKVHHTQEETTYGHWCIRQRQGQNKAKAKGSKDSTDRTRTRARTRTRIRLNVGTVQSADTTRKTVGARRTPTKVVRRENTNPRMQMLTISTRNHQKLNQKSKSVYSTCFTSMLMLLKCKGLNGSRLESTQVQEGRHGLRVSRTRRRFLVTVISLSAPQLENLSKVASDCMSRVATIGDPISEFEVCKRQSVNHHCLLESARRRVVSLCCMVTKVTCSTKVRPLRRKLMLGSRRRGEILNIEVAQLRTKKTTCTTSTSN